MPKGIERAREEWPYASTFNSLDEKEKFIEKFNLPKLIHNKIDSLDVIYLSKE